MFHAAMYWLVLVARAEPGPLPGQPAEDAPAEEDRGPPSEDPSPPTDPSAARGISETFEAVLDVAKQRYFGGEIAVSSELLVGLRERLEAGENPGDDLATESMTYLGEVRFKLQDRAGALDAFRFILRRDPDAPISPYHHPIEVVNLFDLARAEVMAERERPAPLPPPPPPPGPPPVWIFAPLGIPQFGQNRPVAGILFFSVQAGFGVTSLALLENLRDSNRDPDDLADDDAWRQVTRQGLQRKYLMQWPATVAFYGTWALSAVDAGRTWRRRKIDASIGIGPVGERSTGLRFGARF